MRITYLHIILLLLIFCTSQSGIGQSAQFPEYSYRVDKNYFKSYWTVTKKIPTGPARWKAGEWIAFSGVVAGGVILYAFDDDIRKFIQRNPSHGLDVTSEYVFDPWGSYYSVALLGGFYIYGLAAKNNRARQVALGGAQAFLMTHITVQIVKNLTHRHRPYQDTPGNPKLWEGPFKGWENKSFPSGHTAGAFAMASLVSSIYKDKIWVGILSYTMATGVAWSRIYENEHWPSDVLIGAALGFAIGKTVYHLMQGKTNLTMGISDTGGIALVYHLK